MQTVYGLVLQILDNGVTSLGPKRVQSARPACSESVVLGSPPEVSG